MGILDKGGNGRLVHGWNLEQVNKEKSKGRLTDNDLILLEDSQEIWSRGKTWGGKSPDKQNLVGYPFEGNIYEPYLGLKLQSSTNGLGSTVSSVPPYTAVCGWNDIVYQVNPYDNKLISYNILTNTITELEPQPIDILPYDPNQEYDNRVAILPYDKDRISVIRCNRKITAPYSTIISMCLYEPYMGEWTKKTQDYEYPNLNITLESYTSLYLNPESLTWNIYTLYTLDDGLPKLAKIVGNDSTNTAIIMEARLPSTPQNTINIPIRCYDDPNILYIFTIGKRNVEIAQYNISLDSYTAVFEASLALFTQSDDGIFSVKNVFYYGYAKPGNNFILYGERGVLLDYVYLFTIISESEAKYKKLRDFKKGTEEFYYAKSGSMVYTDYPSKVKLITTNFLYQQPGNPAKDVLTQVYETPEYSDTGIIPLSQNDTIIEAFTKLESISKYQEESIEDLQYECLGIKEEVIGASESMTQLEAILT